MAFSYIWRRRFLPVVLYVVMILSGCKPLAVISAIDNNINVSRMVLIC
jgi:hypothetical protein